MTKTIQQHSTGKFAQEIRDIKEQLRITAGELTLRKKDFPFLTH